MWFDTGTTSESEDVRVVGPTNLDSVDCRRFEAKGATEIAGDMTADVATCAGATGVGGNVSVRVFESEGATEIGGSLDADEATCAGATEVVGGTQVDDLRVKGASEFANVASDSFEVKGPVAAEYVSADEVDVHGVVSAERLEARVVTLLLESNTSTVETIVADDVIVERDEEGDEQVTLEATTIEGETVDIEYAEVEKVVGREVNIGPGSHVELVRADDLSVHSDATVERTESLE